MKGLSQRICAVKRYGMTAVNKMDSTKVQFRGRETSLEEITVASNKLEADGWLQGKFKC